MASLPCSQIKLSKVLVRRKFHESGQTNLPRPLHWKPLRPGRFENLVLQCTKNLSWETSLPYASAEDDASIIKGTGVVEPIDTEEAPQIPILQSDEDVVEVKNEPSWHLKAFKLAMWLVGPSILLVTGIVPTLWLPLSSVFHGPNIAGLLSLVGLDFIFNMGAMLFFLMADACSRQENNIFDLKRSALDDLRTETTSSKKTSTFNVDVSACRNGPGHKGPVWFGDGRSEGKAEGGGEDGRTGGGGERGEDAGLPVDGWRDGAWEGGGLREGGGAADRMQGEVRPRADVGRMRRRGRTMWV
ncbi:hypothetical protein ZEAMMB73_Zm00001d028861 [Zea mays]|uniref:Uncharacterized protein n=1 Tax=Zea mays TaxID=4577 RepID=A0A1D6K062_MAIZE|nr:hypothetical protein ZEAMMB73_Zm00001d028861 [Zea mays]